MLSGKRLNILLGLTDPFDYAEFLTGCEAKEIPPLGIIEYAQKMGLCLVARKLYPDMLVSEAYFKLLQEYQTVNVTAVTSGSPKNCGTCGGGQVR